jgi:hypothetical protein
VWVTLSPGEHTSSSHFPTILIGRYNSEYRPLLKEFLSQSTSFETVSFQLFNGISDCASPDGRVVPKSIASSRMRLVYLPFLGNYLFRFSRSILTAIRYSY